MDSFLIGVLLVLTSSIVVARMNSKAKKSDQMPKNIAKDQEAEKKYAAFCEDGETLRVVCRGWKEEYYVLTDRRLIIDNKKGFISIPFDSIKRVDFKNGDGGKARQPSDCQVMIVYADKEYYMARYSGKFNQISEFFFNRN